MMRAQARAGARGRVRCAWILLALGAAAGCPTRPSPMEEAVFRIEACGEVFHVLIRAEQVIHAAEDLIGRDPQKIVAGDLRRGSGGFNVPWTWHLDPGTVQFAEMAIELCDGCPHMVEQDLDYWIGTVGRFCPWGTRVVQRVR